MSNALNPDTRLGAAHLPVSDLDQSVAFYQKALGFPVRWREGTRAHLGAGGADRLTLNEKAGARRARQDSETSAFRQGYAPYRAGCALVEARVIRLSTRGRIISRRSRIE